MASISTSASASTTASASSDGGQSATGIVDDVVQALEARIGGLIENAIDARFSLLSASVNAEQPQTSNTTNVSPLLLEDLTQRAGELASMTTSSSLATLDSAAAGTSTGMP